MCVSTVCGGAYVYILFVGGCIYIIIYVDTNVKVRSPDGDTDYFNIVAGVLQRDTLAPYLFIICLDYVLRTIDKIKENGFKLSKERSRRYPTKTITDTDYANWLCWYGMWPWRPAGSKEQ